MSTYDLSWLDSLVYAGGAQKCWECGAPLVVTQKSTWRTIMGHKVCLDCEGSGGGKGGGGTGHAKGGGGGAAQAQPEKPAEDFHDTGKGRDAAPPTKASVDAIPAASHLAAPKGQTAEEYHGNVVHASRSYDQYKRGHLSPAKYTKTITEGAKRAGLTVAEHKAHIKNYRQKGGDWRTSDSTNPREEMNRVYGQGYDYGASKR